MDYLNSPLGQYEFDEAGKLRLQNDWPVLIETGRDVRADTYIAEVAESFPEPHPLDLVYHELHKDELFIEKRAG